MKEIVKLAVKRNQCIQNNQIVNHGTIRKIKN